MRDRCVRCKSLCELRVTLTVHAERGDRRLGPCCLICAAAMLDAAAPLRAQLAKVIPLGAVMGVATDEEKPA